MKRRRFVNNCFWATTAILTGCSKTVNATIPITFNLLKGKVSSGGKGIADVIVSDGSNVIKTEKDGSFEINVASNLKSVFISIPAGYAFPTNRGLARHYIPLNGSATQRLDFVVDKLRVDDEDHRFIVWADPQMQDDNDVKLFMDETIPDLQEHLQLVPADTLVHGITVGDIVFDNQSLFSKYNSAIEKCKIPFYQVVGNHDIVLNSGKENYSSGFTQQYGPTYYSFNRGKVHYIVLDDVFYNESTYRSFISNEQIDWLKKNLAFVPVDKLLVISLHIPAAWLENKEVLYEVIKDYKVHIMSGHSHYNVNYSSGNIFEHVHGAICGAWWSGPICTDGTPCGYAVYEVKGTEIEWYYKTVGQNKEYQIRTNVYTKNGQLLLQANVWNVDPQWKVEWWADEVLQGEMPKTSDVDYLAAQIYKKEKLPENKVWIKPIQSDHIYSVPIAAGTKKVKVIATDRFGKTYEKITLL